MKQNRRGHGKRDRKKYLPTKACTSTLYIQQQKKDRNRLPKYQRKRRKEKRKERELAVEKHEKRFFFGLRIGMVTFIGSHNFMTS